MISVTVLNIVKLECLQMITLIFIAATNIQEAIHKMNTDLDSLYQRLCMNKLKLNISKTKVLNINAKNNLKREECNIKRVHKILNNLTPIYFQEKIKLADENERKGTLRNRNDIVIENFTKTCTQNSLFFSGLRMYNSLPGEIKDEKSIHKFKTKLKLQMNIN